ncbi:MAG: type 1 glutamine amidotransferase [Proteobacteria bacterium]|nr:type 1 glutamine amidotransferase [Pseudomonadota bacterium]
MSRANVLVIDGNRAATRAQQVAAGGSASGEGYAEVLATLAQVHCEIVHPADGEVHFSPGAGLGSFDAVAITGSALNVYDGGAHIERQVELARAVFAAGMPFFGSCWGMQVAVTAAGGRIRPNPLGREFGFGRRIELTAAGRSHAMFAHKPTVFEAITVHRDDVGELPPDCTVLARNEMGVQALEVRHAGGACWGVQYHPEYTFAEIAATALRYGPTLLGESLFADPRELDAYVTELRGLMADPQDLRLGWKHGLGPGVRHRACQLAELSNWLQSQVLPYAQRRR